MSGLENLTAPQLLAAWADARDLRRNAVYADHPSVRARDERDGDMAMRRVEKEIERRVALRQAQGEGGGENMFGKMRGRFDEQAAADAVRSVGDQVFDGFVALDNDSRMAVAGRINAFFERTHGVRWTVSADFSRGGAS